MTAPIVSTSQKHEKTPRKTLFFLAHANRAHPRQNAATAITTHTTGPHAAISASRLRRAYLSDTHHNRAYSEHFQKIRIDAESRAKVAEAQSARGVMSPRPPIRNSGRSSASGRGLQCQYTRFSHARQTFYYFRIGRVCVLVFIFAWLSGVVVVRAGATTPPWIIFVLLCVGCVSFESCCIFVFFFFNVGFFYDFCLVF